MGCRCHSSSSKTKSLMADIDSYFASILKKSVRTEEFTGTEEQARHRVAILNLYRRHLTAAQHVLAARQLFSEDARKETAEAQKKGGAKGGQNRSSFRTLVSGDQDKKRGPQFEEIVAHKAQNVGLHGVTPRSVKALSGIEHAPETKARIERGEIIRIGDVKPAIDAELRRNKVSPMQTITPSALSPDRSVNMQLGQALKAFTDIVNDPEKEAGKMPAQIVERWDAIKRIIPDVERMLHRRGLI